MAKKFTCWQAAEILAFSDRHLRRIRERYEEFSYESMFDKRRGQPTLKRVPFATVEKVLALYREKYFDLNGRHFHERLREQHAIDLSYTWVKSVLQGAGLIARQRQRGSHRKRRPRRYLGSPPARGARALRFSPSHQGCASHRGRTNEGHAREAIVLACISKTYFAEPLRTAGATLLLWTTSLMAPKACTLKSALDGWVLGEIPGTDSRASRGSLQQISALLAGRSQAVAGHGILG